MSKIAEIRSATLNVTQKEVARAASCSIKTILRVEEGRSNVGRREQAKVLRGINRIARSNNLDQQWKYDEVFGD